LPYLTAYADRCRDRPAYRAAENLNWPPEMFANVKPAP
jgi:hypothetical protein